MSGFSTDWLSLREPAEQPTARSVALAVDAAAK